VPAVHCQTQAVTTKNAKQGEQRATKLITFKLESALRKKRHLGGRRSRAASRSPKIIKKEKRKVKNVVRGVKRIHLQQLRGFVVVGWVGKINRSDSRKTPTVLHRE